MKPITYYCETPTILAMCDRFGERFERLSACDRNLLIWVLTQGQVIDACALVEAPVSSLDGQLANVAWIEFSDALAKDIAEAPSLARQLIHSLTAD